VDTDLILVVGAVVSALAIPSMLAAYSESRPPRGGAVLLLIGGTLLVVALTQKPSGYTFAEVPDAFYRVVGRFVN
jgi:hypothetical protein